MTSKTSFETLKGLSSNNSGLTDAEVNLQRERYGANKVVESVGNLWPELIKETVKDPMIWFLVGIGSVFFFIGNVTEGITLFIAILPLLFMDAFLNWRTQASTISLKKNLATEANVLRNNKELLIDSNEIVPGDIIILKPGTILPADGFFQNIVEMQLDESALTGESFPTRKKNITIKPFELTSASNILVNTETLGFAGTRVLTGEGQFRVLVTGNKTAYGEIIQSVVNMPKERTPLQKSITKLVTWLIIASGIFCLILAAARLYQGHGWLDALLSAATLAIAAIPEEFPVVFSFFLGVGVYRLAKKHALVRRAVSVENIGRITYVCTDKTGTITKGLLKLTHLDPYDGLNENDILEASFYATSPEGSDPIDQAIQEVAIEAKILPIKSIERFPFTEDRKRETAILQLNDSYIAYIKGSPELILNQSNLNPQKKKLWHEKIESWAQGGHKVLGIAKKVISSTNIEPEDDYEFCGLLAFEDPSRPEVAPSIEYCRKNGIRVIMITGDHPMTSAAIAKDIGLGGDSPNVISAEDNSVKFSEQYFFDKIDVVARCTPLQKLKIVNALKKQGEIVAVTGDGVNDVPALKAADIGIAMGKRGTQSAKEVSSIILADDNFKTIVNAIMEGRQLFLNLRLSFEYLLLFHIPFVFTAALVPLFDYPILYLPIHIVWLELIIHPTALFAFQKEASEDDNIPQAQKEFFTRSRVVFILLIGSSLSLVISYISQEDFSTNPNVDYARTKAMALLMLWSACLVLHFTKIKYRAAIFIFGGTILSAILLIQTSILSSYIHVTPLALWDWVTSLSIIVVFFLLLIIGKKYLK